MAVVDPLVQSEANATMKEKHVTAEKEDQLAAITNVSVNSRNRTKYHVIYVIRHFPNI